MQTNTYIMKKIKTLIVTMLLMLSTAAGASQLDTWTYYLAYPDLTHVVPAGKTVFALSDGRLYSYDTTDESLFEHNFNTTLNDNNLITDICYNSSCKALIICYEDNAIDILNVASNETHYVTDIKNEITSLSKDIVNVISFGKNAYIVLKWGVVILNIENKEITTTYRLDTDGEAIDGAYEEKGMLYISATKNIGTFGGNMIYGALSSNLLDKSNWSVTDATTATSIRTKIANDRQSRNIYNIKNPKSKNAELIADKQNNCFWGSNDDNTLTKYIKNDLGNYEQASNPIKPYGPAKNNFYNIRFLYNKLYTVGQGYIRDVGADIAMDGIVQTMTTDGKWQRYETPDAKILDHPYTACNDIAVDPRDTSHVMIGSRDGLYEFSSGKFVKYYNNTNSIIKSLYDGTSPRYNLLLSTIYDKSGNLYMFNSYCSNGMLQIPAGSTEITHIPNKLLDTWKPNEKFFVNPFFDSRGLLWFVNMHWYGMSFYVYNTDTKVLKQYIPSNNQDGSTVYDDQGTGYLRHISEDKEGNIWIAGTKGIAYIPKDQINDLTTTVYQHKVNRNDGYGYADYLLSTVDASCIIFDSANRMYVSTKGSGIYVISADRNVELKHYTTENSNIMSDYVNYLALDPNTGVLYASTNLGLCSVATDAMQVPESLSTDNIKVYPNPMAPDYYGPINIEGLTVGANIKIATATGVTVHEGYTSSSVYQWDGCDFSGKRCASGVYNILLVDAQGEKGCVAKLAIIK